MHRLSDLSLSLGHTLTEIPASEQRVCELLAPLLRSNGVGDAIVTPPDDGDAFYSFEFFLPGILCEVHAEWQHESLDGIYPQLFCKTAEREIELIGMALFISDQALTPLHLRLQLSRDYDCVSWLDLQLGERIDGKCRRDPYGSSKGMRYIVDRLDSIDWYYHVGFGERET